MFKRIDHIEISWGPIDLGGPKRIEIKDLDGISIELRQWQKTSFETNER